jgi:DNA-binding NarL/FixJ family response regulator
MQDVSGPVPDRAQFQELPLGFHVLRQRRGTMRVLICEVDDLLLNLLRDALADTGHEVCGFAARSREALLLAAELRPDAAIVNPRLRDGYTGIPLTDDFALLGTPTVLIAKDVLVVSPCHSRQNHPRYAI